MPQAPSSHPTEGQNIRTTETWNNRTNRNNSKKNNYLWEEDQNGHIFVTVPLTYLK
jgi:hypothetical protein